MCEQQNGVDLGDDVYELSANDDSEPEEQPCPTLFDPELDHSDEEEVEEIRAPVGLGAQFSLRGGGSAFSSRSHSIFDCLDNVARLSSSSSSFSGQQSNSDGVFARPAPAKRRRTPDYLLHPERWTHYTLEEVSETSDHDNRRSALSYLSDLKERKEEEQRRKKEPKREQQERVSSNSPLPQKMIYSKPSRQMSDRTTETSAVRNREKKTHLSHLQEEEQEEGEKHEPGGKRTVQNVEKAEENQTVGTEEQIGDQNISFTSFRKTKPKNYRRSSGREDN